MMIRHQAPQPLFQNMSINLGCGNVGVPEELLHGSEIGAPVEEMACESVTKHMRADAARIDPCGLGKLLEFLGETLSREVPFCAF